MTGKPETADPGTTDEAVDPTSQTLARRTFLGGIAAVGAVPGIQDYGNQTDGNQTDGNQTEDGDDVETHFEFGGEVDGWQGQSPSEIEGETNPTLNLQAGTQYRVTWENLDGVDHDFTILDADGNEITSTETMAEQGETRSLTFTATREMDQYVCTIHPNRMQGRIQIGDGTPAGETPTEAEEVEIDFQLGGEVDGWQGQSPSEIEGETNPTLDLQAGNRYRVTWENLDGVQHNFAILDADGNEMTSTEIESLEGETRSLTFTATREMDQYYCAIHTDRMRGDLQIDGGTPIDETPTEDGEAVETRFELGGVIGGWQGRLPEERGADNYIAGEQNPTLELEAGAQYMVVWENGDGVPHDFTILDADENQMMSTEITSKQGETRSLTFTATQEMDQYVCTIHPDTMRGEIQVGGDDVGELLFTGPVQMVGGMAAVTAGFVGGLSYLLAKYFDDSHEP